jgi:hypothetical protein
MHRDVALGALVIPFLVRALLKVFVLVVSVAVGVPLRLKVVVHSVYFVVLVLLALVAETYLNLCFSLLFLVSTPQMSWDINTYQM